MNSKKALKRLYLNNYTIEELSVVHSDIKDYDLVFQDLDKLEKLEKENQELKNTILSLELDTCIPELRKENTKFKNVIEKIKSLPNCDICDANWHKGCMCLQNKFIPALFSSSTFLPQYQISFQLV